LRNPLRSFNRIQTSGIFFMEKTFLDCWSAFKKKL